MSIIRRLKNNLVLRQAYHIRRLLVANKNLTEENSILIRRVNQQERRIRAVEEQAIDLQDQIIELELVTTALVPDPE